MKDSHRPDRAMTTTNPATEEVLDTYPLMSDDEMISALEACHAAFEEWRLKSHKDRGEVMKAIGAKLRDRKEEFAKLMTQEMGKRLLDSRDDRVADFVRVRDRGPRLIERRDHGPEDIALRSVVG